MALFDPAQPRTPTQVREATITLRVREGTPRDYAAGMRFDVLDASGAVLEVRDGNLVPELNATQVTQLRAFVDAMFSKAQGTTP